MRKPLLFAAALAATVAEAAILSPAQAQPYGGHGYGSGWGMMNGWGYGGFGYGPFHLIIWIVILIAIVALVVWLVRSLGGGGHQLLPRRPVGLDVLEERYARGEVNREEYLQKKRDMAG